MVFLWSSMLELQKSIPGRDAAFWIAYKMVPRSISLILGWFWIIIKQSLLLRKRISNTQTTTDLCLVEPERQRRESREKRAFLCWHQSWCRCFKHQHWCSDETWSRVGRWTKLKRFKRGAWLIEVVQPVAKVFESASPKTCTKWQANSLARAILLAAMESIFSMADVKLQTEIHRHRHWQRRQQQQTGRSRGESSASPSLANRLCLHCHPALAPSLALKLSCCCL